MTIFCYLEDCWCSANYKNASFTLPPKEKEVHPKVVPALKRENANLSEDKENLPPNVAETDPKHNESQET